MSPRPTSRPRASALALPASFVLLILLTISPSGLLGEASRDFPTRLDRARWSPQGPAELARFVTRGDHRRLPPEQRDEFFVDFALQAPEYLALVWDEVEGQVPPTALRLAAPEFEDRALERLEGLSPVEEIGLLLGRARDLGSKRARKERRKAIRALMKDPAVKENFARIEDSWFRGLLVSGLERGAGAGLLYARPEELVEVKVLVARNLFFAGVEVGRESVVREAQRLVELRRSYRKTRVFRQRQLIFVATRERAASTGDAVFASDKVRRALDRSAAEVRFHGGERASGRSPVRQVLHELEGSDRPTFLFAGHGRPSALKYRRGIKAAHLARALARQQLRGADREPAVVMILSCRGNDFGRRVLSQLDRIDPEIPKPVVITAEEYGQNWEKPVYGDRLSRVVNRDALTLGHLAREWSSGTSIFVPGPDNRPRQIY